MIHYGSTARQKTVCATIKFVCKQWCRQRKENGKGYQRRLLGPHHETTVQLGLRLRE
jgi:hypothetical protein